MVKNPFVNGNVRETGSSPGLKDSLEEGTATHSSIPGESHGQRSWKGYSPWDHKELDITKAT